MTGDVMDLLQYTFFQHALLGSLLASIACGIIGTYIVTWYLSAEESLMLLSEGSG